VSEFLFYFIFLLRKASQASKANLEDVSYCEQFLLDELLLLMNQDENLSSKTAESTTASLSISSNTTVSSTNSPNLTQLERTAPSLPLPNSSVQPMVWSTNNY